MKHFIVTLLVGFWLLGPHAFADVNAKNGISITTASTINGKTPNSAFNGLTIAGGGTPIDFVTSFTNTGGATANNFTGGVGYKFTVNVSGMTVTHLARWVIAGNSGTHTVRLRNSSGTELCTASVNTSGAPTGAFLYAIASTPVALTNGATYYILSDETNAGDFWYNEDSSGFATTSDATVNVSAYYDGSLHDGSQLYFGPVSMRYTL